MSDTHVHKYLFGGADLAAAASPAALPVLGEPDTADFSKIPVPRGMRLIGLTLVGSPASGDTVTVQAIQNSTAVGPTAVINNTLKTQNVLVGFNDSVLFAQFDTIGMQYTTTTGGTYTARDLYVEAIFADLDD